MKQPFHMNQKLRIHSLLMRSVAKYVNNSLFYKLVPNMSRMLLYYCMTCNTPKLKTGFLSRFEKKNN